MNRKIMIINIILCCSLSFFAKAEKYHFKITDSQNNKREILVVGSNHSAPLSILPKSLIQEIKSKDILIMESETASTLSSSQQLSDAYKQYEKLFPEVKDLLIAKQAFFIDGKPWAKSLKPEKHKVIEEAFKKEAKHQFDKLDPRIVIMVINFSLSAQLQKFGMDASLRRFFESSNKKIFYLESTGERSDKEAFEKHKSLLNNIKSNPKIPEKAIKVVDVALENYLLRDHLSTKQLLQRTRVSEKPFYKDYLNNGIIGISKYFEEGWIDENIIRRNKLWGPRILDILNKNPDKSVVIVVGASHLVGKESILRILNKNLS